MMHHKVQGAILFHLSYFYYGCLLENVLLLSLCLLLQHLRFRACIFKVPLPKSPVRSDWSALTGLSVQGVEVTKIRV